jgi:hypothetical protein
MGPVGPVGPDVTETVAAVGVCTCTVVVDEPSTMVSSEVCETMTTSVIV